MIYLPALFFLISGIFNASLLRRAGNNSPLRSVRACVWLLTDILHYRKPQPQYFPRTVEGHHLQHSNCTGGEEPLAGKAASSLAPLGDEALELVPSSKNSSWCGEMACCEWTAGWAHQPYTALGAWSYTPPPSTKWLKLHTESSFCEYSNELRFWRIWGHFLSFHSSQFILSGASFEK